MEFIAEYGLFLAKTVTLVVVLLIVMIMVASFREKDKGRHFGHIEVYYLNDRINKMKLTVRHAVQDKFDIKQDAKAEKIRLKTEAKAKKQAFKTRKIGGESEPGAAVGISAARKRVYVLDFDGDVRASEVDQLREEITAVLGVAKPDDEVVLRLESSGGMVHSYGLAASQLQRIKAKGVPLTVCVDKVAASGGYMMACLGSRILAAPFAVIGSIGVVAQIPNFHRILKKHDVDYEVLTAGEHKRTLTMLGENTDKGRQKFLQDLEDTHALFKDFVSQNRPVVDIHAVATGEIWFGQRALQRALVDEIKTSDEYLNHACESADVYEVEYVTKKSFQERFSLGLQLAAEGVMTKCWERISGSRFFV